MPLPVRVIEIPERGQRVFPRTELFDPHGRSLIFPEVRELSAIEITDTPDGARLMALGLIGYLPLTSTITLNIIPKFPIRNLWAMLEIGEETYTYTNVLPVIRRYQTSSSPAPIQMLARSFCHYLKGALSDGFERSYYPRQQSGFYRPRVEFGPTLSRFLSRGNPVDTVSNVFEFGVDSVNGGDKTGHGAAQNQASGGGRAPWRARSPDSWRGPWRIGPQGQSCDG